LHKAHTHNDSHEILQTSSSSSLASMVAQPLQVDTENEEAEVRPDSFCDMVSTSFISSPDITLMGPPVETICGFPHDDVSDEMVVCDGSSDDANKMPPDNNDKVVELNINSNYIPITEAPEEDTRIFDPPPVASPIEVIVQQAIPMEHPPRSSQHELNKHKAFSSLCNYIFGKVCMATRHELLCTLCSSGTNKKDMGFDFYGTVENDEDMTNNQTSDSLKSFSSSFPSPLALATAPAADTDVVGADGSTVLQSSTVVAKESTSPLQLLPTLNQFRSPMFSLLVSRKFKTPPVVITSPQKIKASEETVEYISPQCGGIKNTSQNSAMNVVGTTDEEEDFDQINRRMDLSEV
jgi:hypothetical protein